MGGTKSVKRKLQINNSSSKTASKTSNASKTSSIFATKLDMPQFSNTTKPNYRVASGASSVQPPNAMQSFHKNVSNNAQFLENSLNANRNRVKMATATLRTISQSISPRRRTRNVNSNAMLVQSANLGANRHVAKTNV